MPKKVISEAESAVQSKTKKTADERQDMTTLHERTIATLSYFGFLAIVPFYLKRDSEFCRFHGKQGLLLSIIFFLAQLLTAIDLFFDLMIILQVVILFVFGFSALSGRWRKVPIIYDWACQLDEVLTLKTKEEEMDAPALRPNQVAPTEKTEMPSS